MKPHQLIARYIRGQLAMTGLTQTEVAERLGFPNQQALSRRLTGTTPFTIDELTAVVQMLGLDYAEVVNEIQRMSRRNDVQPQS